MAEQAEALKLKGNQCFQKGKFHAAIDMYTEAIVLNPNQSTYYSNRALCNSKLERWPLCRDDCTLALKYDSLNAKASYLLGVSQMHLELFEDAILSLQTALISAEKTKKTQGFQRDIGLELRRVKKAQWQHQQLKQIRQHDQMKLQLAELFAVKAKDSGYETASMEQLDSLIAYMEHVTAKFEKEMHPGEIPEYFMCPVSMEIMDDPVTTPNGVSYERNYIEEHLRKNGPIDPLTRKKLTLDMLRPNTSLRAAIQDYLEKHPWAFEY